MRVPLGSLFSATTFATHATLWPYLPRFMPRHLCSIGLGDPAAAELYRPGPEVLLVAADCDGLRALAGPGRWAIAALGLASLSAAGHLRELGATRHAACHRGPSGRRPADGFDDWRRLRLSVTLDLKPDSPVWPTDDGLRVRLPATMALQAFMDVLRDAIDIVSVDAVVATRQGRRRCADLGLHPGRYARETALDAGGRAVRARADDLYFFRPGLDADALVAVVEMIVAGHLADLAQGRATPFR